VNTKGKEKISKQNPGFKNSNRYILGFAILLVGMTVGIIISSNFETETAEQPEMSIVYSMATIDIAKNFACSCGSCGEENLSTCTCPKAISTKKFIEMNLNSGLPADEIIELIKVTHGHYLG